VFWLSKNAACITVIFSFYVLKKNPCVRSKGLRTFRLQR
jgi:hypothetical protein